jgi:hypothetical protein
MRAVFTNVADLNKTNGNKMTNNVKFRNSHLYFRQKGER